MKLELLGIRGAVAILAIALALGCDPAGAPPPTGDGGDGTRDAGGPVGGDADGDGILDMWEDRSTEVDTDGDGTPDYLDEDSDDDGIPDSVEGNPFAGGMPVDSDSDGTYDFRDDDSDGNGIGDSSDSTEDLDGDGLLDFADLDDDGDNIIDADEIGDPAAPVDTDGDSLPDYRDEDSDDDTIADLHESIVDTDGDETLDRHDLDSDGDGWTDAEEAGDDDLITVPVDTDGDTIPDFRDTDSDGDGLSDRREREVGTARDNADTDGDGVSDLVELAACPEGDMSCAMDATDPTSSPRERGDFVFAEPYMMPPMPPRDTLVFATDLQFADVYFLVDTTGSMGGAIANVRASLSTPSTGIIDQVRAEIADVQFGVGGFDDYPVSPYGSAASGDRAYYHLQDLTASTADAQTAVDSLTTHFGSDGAESGVAAMHAVATGMGLPGTSGWTEDRATSSSFSPCAMGNFGWPCFRPGAVPIIVLISDIYQHNGPPGIDENPYLDATIGGHAPTYAETLAALMAARVRVIGVSVRGGGTAQMNQFAMDTGAVDGTGAPLVSTASDGSVSAAVVNQIRTLANQTPLDVTVEYVDDPSDTVDTWAAFVDHIEANEAGDAGRGCDPRAAEDTDMDGYPDTFRAVTPGSPVCFDIVVKQNDTVMPTTTPQLFMATLRVLGDGFTELDRRDIFFLVPPEPELPGGPD